MSDYNFSITIDSEGVPKINISYMSVETTADGFRAIGKMCDIAADLMDTIEAKLAAANEAAVFAAAHKPKTVSGAERLSG